MRTNATRSGALPPRSSPSLAFARSVVSLGRKRPRSRGKPPYPQHCGLVSLHLTLPRCLLVALCLPRRHPRYGRVSLGQTQPCRRRSSSSTVRQRQTPSSCGAVITNPNPHAAPNTKLARGTSPLARLPHSLSLVRSGRRAVMGD